ncbi:type I secretion system permease/ATPase [Ramlibacter sp.]|uniref:type I secretion system permease/ATPase n=1 Tax=Ramlibacter sp. TaxID=1917967 RepID=UPI002D408BDE|nr:type I secretion system permease/ATPase [Ramlibacter sp.]HYD75386.1 type I secretion system permease/ATPase [Ramlibacter sp.]
MSSDLLAGLAPWRRPVLASGWLAGVLALAPAIYMLEVYGRVVNSRSATTLWMLSLLVVGAFVVMELLEWLRSRLLQHAAASLDDALAPRLFRIALQAAPMQQPGSDGQALQDWRIVRRFIHSPAAHGLLDTPVSLLFLLAVFWISPWLGVFAMAGALLQVGLATATERATGPVMRKANAEAAASGRRADETVRNAEVLASMGMAGRMEALWIERQAQALALQAQASERAGTSSALARWGQNIVGSGLLGLGCWLLLADDLWGGPAMMIVASILGGRVLAPLLQVLIQWTQVTAARQAWQRLQQLLSLYPETPVGLPLPAPKGELSVESLVAGVPGPRPGPPILKGISFRLARGESLAVIGPSAAGKSTLARMLVGLWPAQQGAVRLDGFDLFAWDREEVGRHIGYLPQDVQLLPGTIADNICRFEGADPAAVEQAARRVGLHEAIAALPQGYETSIDDASRLLSGGERQRLGLAAALYGQPALVVLDEPNSSLDAAGEQALQQAMAEMKASGTTFVVITHRTQLLDTADKLLLLVDGQAKAFGPRQQVLAALAGGKPAGGSGA